jgi:hypothetical protein
VSFVTFVVRAEKLTAKRAKTAVNVRRPLFLNHEEHKEH